MSNTETPESGNLLSFLIFKCFLCLCPTSCNARELFQRKFIRVVAKMAIQIGALTEQFRSSEALRERSHISRLRSNKDIQSEVRRRSE